MSEPRKKNKDSRKVEHRDNWEAEGSKSKQDRKSLKDYNWTTLNAPIMDVLMEIKRDPAYRRPKTILSQPNSQFPDQYSAFHDATGHRTEACISLRILIEHFIENSKLVRFLMDQRNTTNPE